MIYALVVPGPIPDVEQIRILEWHGAIGQKFEPEEMLVELETYKALVEVRAGQPGFLRKIISEAGNWEDVGAPIALFSDTADEALPANTEQIADLPASFEVS